MKVTIDMDTLKRHIKKNNQRFEAIGDTLKPGGRGEVACSRRIKMRWERKKSKGRGDKKEVIRKGKKTLSGWAIANFLRKQGMDAFDYPRAPAMKIIRWWEDRIASAITIAERTGKPQKRTMERVLTRVADMFAEVAVTQLTKGRLRPNAYKYRQKKERLVRAGYGLRKFGIPPPPGIWTGRYYQGIRARFRRAFTPGARS